MKHAFVNAQGVLKCWGFVETNEVSDIRLDVAEDFALETRKWRWDGQAWQLYQAPVIKSDKDLAIEELKTLDEKKATVEDVVKLLRRAL